MREAFHRPVNAFIVGAVLCVALCVCPSQALAQRGPSFEALGTIPDSGTFPATSGTGLSGDGLVVIGFATNGNILVQPFRWTRSSGFEILPQVATASESIPGAVSRDGRVVVGTANVGRFSRGFRWRKGLGTTPLGDLPGGDVSSHGEGVSRDGVVVVGGSLSAMGDEAFRWTLSGGMVPMGFLPGAITSRALDASEDGSVIVGDSFGPQGAGIGGGFRWTASEGMVPLGFSGGFTTNGADFVSADGSVIVGTALNAGGNLETFRWTAAGGMVGLGDAKGGPFGGNATAMSADGNVIVNRQGMIWDSVKGQRTIQSVLENEAGVDMTGWHITSADGISDDGRVVAGTVVDITGFPQAYIAVLTECGKDADCGDGVFCNGVEVCVNNVCMPGAPPCEAGDPCLETEGVCTSSIPTVSQWGLIAMTLLLLTATTCVLRQRKVPDR